MMITSSLRQGLYILFIILIMMVGPVFLSLSIFQIFIIIIGAGIILKLTDIEGAIRKDW